MRAFDVYANVSKRAARKEMDTVFAVDSMTAEEMRRSLVEHDGYPAGIIVVKRDKHGRAMDVAPRED